MQLAGVFGFLVIGVAASPEDDGWKGQASRNLHLNLLLVALEL